MVDRRLFGFRAPRGRATAIFPLRGLRAPMGFVPSPLAEKLAGPAPVGAASRVPTPGIDGFGACFVSIRSASRVALAGADIRTVRDGKRALPLRQSAVAASRSRTGGCTAAARRAGRSPPRC